MNKFGDKKYLIEDFSGAAEGEKFFTLESLVDGPSKIFSYSLLGEALSEVNLDIQGSDLEVDSTGSFALVYSYQMDKVILVDLHTGEEISRMGCKKLNFIGFIRNKPLVQDGFGKLWRMSVGFEEASLIGDSPFILACLDIGKLRVLLCGKKQAIIHRENFDFPFVFNRRGLLCYDPRVSIFGESDYVLVTETNGGIRFFALDGEGCHLRMDYGNGNSFKCATYCQATEEIIAISEDKSAPNHSIIYYIKTNRETREKRIDFAPVPSHFFADGKACANRARQLIRF